MELKPTKSQVLPSTRILATVWNTHVILRQELGKGTLHTAKASNALIGTERGNFEDN